MIELSPAFYREVEKKTKLLRADYGGMMSIKDLMRELGFGSHHTVNNWVRDTGLEGVRIGRSVRYETDQVARVIVSARGMV